MALKGRLGRTKDSKAAEAIDVSIWALSYIVKCLGWEYQWIVCFLPNVTRKKTIYWIEHSYEYYIH